MTQDEIIAMATQVYGECNWHKSALLRLEAFVKLVAAKAFQNGYEKDLTGKATLAAEDIRFARTIERIQRIVVSELTKIALVHLYSQGYRDESMTNFELSMNRGLVRLCPLAVLGV